MKTDFYLVFTNPVAGREDAYNDWYTNIHIPDLVRIPHVVAGQRFRLEPVPGGGGAPKTGYLAIYELSDTPAGLGGIASRRGGPELRMMSPPVHETLYRHVLTPVLRQPQESGGKFGPDGVVLVALLSGAAAMIGTLKARLASLGLALAAGGLTILSRSAAIEQAASPDLGFLMEFASREALERQWQKITALIAAMTRSAPELALAIPITPRAVASGP